MMKLHEDHKKLIIVVFFGVISLAALIGSSYIENRRITSSTQAANNTPSRCNCTDPNNCYPDGCSGKPKTPDNKLDSNRYDQVCKNINFGWPPDIDVQKYFCSIRQPDSCFDVYQYKDDRYACFMERWFCHPSLCEGAGGNGDCGKYWHLPGGWDSYGCVEKKNGQTVPLWGPLPPGLPGALQPTNTQAPQATSTPRPPTATLKPNQPTPTAGSKPTLAPISTNQPTQSPPQETRYIEPSYIPPATNIPIPTNTPYQFPTIEIKSPKELAREVINPQNIQKLNRSTEKVFNTPKEGLNIIKQADLKLEHSANALIERVRIFIENLIN